MSFISPFSGYAIFICYGAFMFLLTYFFTKKDQSKDEHLVANRKVSVFSGAFSIAVTWIWAPAIFIASQKSFEQGIAGIFWFTVPNIVCFFTFAALAVKLKKVLPLGYSFPDFVWMRFSRDKKTHLSFLFVSFGYELSAIVINTLAGAFLMKNLAGIEFHLSILILSGIALFYSAWRGLPASIITDIVQMSMIIFIAFLLVPWTLHSSGGLATILHGLGGVSGKFTNLFDPLVVFSFGLPATLGLISGPIADQMFYQRAMATERERIVKTFVYGGLLFGIVPVLLSVFGFVGAAPEIVKHLNISDPQMIGVSVVKYFLPHWTLFGFAFMALCGLSSTLDSAYCAIGSLFSVDVYEKYINPKANDDQMIKASQISMIVFTLIGVSIAMIPGIKLLWIFLIYGSLASCALMPTLFSLYSKKISANFVFASVLVSVLTSLPLSIYANATQNSKLIFLSSISGILIGGLICIIGVNIKKTEG